MVGRKISLFMIQHGKKNPHQKRGDNVINEKEYTVLNRGGRNKTEDVNT